MMKLASEITADLPFVAIVDEFTDINYESLTNLYAPIVGSAAINLYNLLQSMARHSPISTLRHTHYELQSMLNEPLTQLQHNRQKLEAVGLMSTYEAGERLIYRMRLPLQATAFLQKDALALLLLDNVGDQTFDQIVMRLLPQLDNDDGLDVSVAISELYPTLLKNSVNTKSEIVNTRQHIDEHNLSENTLEINSDQLDVKLLLNILTNTFVDLASVKANLDLIKTESSLYGINELQMANLIQKATNLKTNQLEINVLKHNISKTYQSNPATTIKSVANKPQLQSADNSVSKKFEQIIKIAQQTAPLIFLQQIKKQKNGFVTSGEERLIRDLISRHLFPNEVVNVLIYHILVDENNGALNKNLTETIANDWSQHKVASAAEAINVIQGRNQAKTNKKNNNYRNNNNRKANVKETLPEWAKTNNKDTKTTKLSKEQQQQLNERLKKIQTKK